MVVAYLEKNMRVLPFCSFLKENILKKLAIIRHSAKDCMRFIFIIIALFSITSCSAYLKKEEPVIRGVYDATLLEEGDIVELEGEWIFVASHFVCPSEDFSHFKRYEQINRGWNTYREAEADLGYGTYALKITGLLPNKVYAIKTSECLSAFTAFLNGKEFFHLGRVGKTKAEEVPALDAPFMILPTDGKRNVMLVFHVSNFNNKYTGFSKPIKFGFYSTIQTAKNKDSITFIFIVGTLLLLASLFISLYLFYSRERLALYFGLICANFAIRTCCYDEFLINSIFPFFSFNVVFKTGYATFTLAIILVSLFIQQLFRMTKKGMLLVLFIPAFIYLSVNIFASSYISSSYLIYAQIYVLSLGIYNVVLVCIKSIKKNRAAHLFLLGLFLFLFVAVRDVFVANRLIGGGFIAHFGVFGLLIPMSIIVLRSFKMSSDRLSIATDNIEKINTALSRFLPDEFTKLLNKKHVEIKLGDNVLKDMYVSFIYLNICKNISEKKDRENALSVYNEALSYINPIIEYHNGFVDKYLPDGLMILFENNAENVIKCMLQIALLVQRENIERALSGKDEFNFACGIHYGPLLIGTIGEVERMDNTVIADSVNIASRLQSYALKQNISIVVSQVVKDNFEDDITEDYVNFTYKGRVKLKGKSEEIEIYEVTRE